MEGTRHPLRGFSQNIHTTKNRKQVRLSNSTKVEPKEKRKHTSPPEINMSFPTNTAEKPSNDALQTTSTEHSATDNAPNTVEARTEHDSTASTTKSEVELAADKLYEERIEEEYAKREGGA
jgi:hypothetical protein